MKFAKSAALVVAMLLATTALASAQAPAEATGTAVADTVISFHGIGIGLVIVGAALGIGRLTASAVESMARQPEIAANIQTAMIISAALIEGVSFFAVIVIGFILK
ncbi:ATP synthase F0 subunit C [Tundrisphaera lichenicola]|uniref:ATP synthase F0 subunit C n=1 Tax=Tundrisphaera lichenicola TaxID=2029860 RepID=UPI003EBF9E85